jgi:hypothetical protein
LSKVRLHALKTALKVICPLLPSRDKESKAHKLTIMNKDLEGWREGSTSPSWVVFSAPIAYYAAFPSADGQQLRKTKFLMQHRPVTMQQSKAWEPELLKAPGL